MVAAHQGKRKDPVQFITHQTCLKPSQIYDLLAAEGLREKLCGYPQNEEPQPTILIEALRGVIPPSRMVGACDLAYKRCTDNAMAGLRTRIHRHLVPISLAIVVFGMGCIAGAQQLPDSLNVRGLTQLGLNPLTPGFSNPLRPMTDDFFISSGLSTNLFSDPPKLMGRYSWNGQTIMPYVGLGFSHGEPTDMNRTIILEDRILRQGFGQTMTPNDFQLGLRLPF